MSTRKHPSRFRAVRPAPEGLEDRQLLSGVVSGVDGDGDQWTLRLIGPGALRVVRQPDATGDPAPLSSPGQIASITIAGTSARQTRLVGAVRRGSSGDGRVFFQELTEIPNHATLLVAGNSPLSIDMPNFWLGLTNANGATTSTEPQIDIPDGVNTLRFGGVDVNAFFGQDPTKSLPQNGQADSVNISLGLPQSGGTRIVVDSVISNAQAATTSTGTPTQDSVNFIVTGRLNLFQANSIQGNTTIPSSDFGASGGTFVTSRADQTLGITGQIGFVRVGGNATNFAVSTNDRISNYFVGGETNNVSILAPAGSRNIYFGKGMDTATIKTHTIENLQANRGALNSSVVSDRGIGHVNIGGDVVGSSILSGYEQQLSTIFSSPSNVPTPTTQANGSINITIGGAVTDSVIAASNDPFDGTFGTSQGLNLPGGKVYAKIEGQIDNTNVTPDSPNTAFYAKSVRLYRGPVIPPNVPEMPFTRPISPLSLPGVPNLNSLNKRILPRTTVTGASHPTGPKS